MATQIGSKEWRALPQEQKEELTNKIVKYLKSRVRHMEIVRRLNVRKNVVSRISENNGLARKGPYKGKSPAIVPNPLVTDIDVPPDDSIILFVPPDDSITLVSKSNSTEEAPATNNIPESQEKIEKFPVDQENYSISDLIHYLQIDVRFIAERMGFTGENQVKKVKVEFETINGNTVVLYT